MSDRMYWFFRNLSSFILILIITPIYLAMLTLELLYDGLIGVIKMDGSTTMSFPWEIEWPFFRSEE